MAKNQSQSESHGDRYITLLFGALRFWDGCEILFFFLIIMRLLYSPVTQCAMCNFGLGFPRVVLEDR